MLLRTLLAAAALLVSLEMTASAEIVSVLTDNGQSHHGEVDARTDETSLWLRHDEPNFALSFNIDWASIQHVTVDGEAIALEDVRQILSSLATHRSAGSILMDPVPTAQLSPTMIEPHAHRKSSPRIAALSIEARLANWDADPQADGVELVVFATDRHGNAWPVRGNLTVRMLGERQVSRHRFSHRELQRWHEPVREEHFGHDGLAVRYRLEFRSIQPDTDQRIWEEAVIHATLGVHGHGNFSASTQLWLRDFSPLRDRLEEQRRTRQFPIERGRPVVREIQRYVPPASSFRSASPESL